MSSSVHSVSYDFPFNNNSLKFPIFLNFRVKIDFEHTLFSLVTRNVLVINVKINNSPFGYGENFPDKILTHKICISWFFFRYATKQIKKYIYKCIYLYIFFFICLVAYRKNPQEINILCASFLSGKFSPYPKRLLFILTLITNTYKSSYRSIYVEKSSKSTNFKVF